MPRRTRLVALAFAALAAAACGKEAPPSEPDVAAARLNLVLVVVDTLRADHLEIYGATRQTSPELLRLAARGTLFEQARSQASCTFPSANSLLTSQPPIRFLGQADGRMGIPPEIKSVAEILSSHGYQAAAISASPIVRKSPTRFNAHGGFERGFGTFNEVCLWQAASCLNREAEVLLPTLTEPFFLYLHFMDPHGPYRPPPEHARRFARAIQAPGWVREGDPNPIAKAISETGAPPAGSGPWIEHLSDLYDDEILYFDAQLPRLLELLARRGVLDRTLLLLVADHGESFLEHGAIKHCQAPFDPQVKTPFLAILPGGAAGRRIPWPVENLDAVPTLLDAAGLRPETFGLAGRSLLLWLGAGETPAPTEPRFAVSSQGPWRSLTDGRFKLLLDLSTRRLALFDLDADPGELQDLSASRPEELRRLRQALFEHLTRTEGSAQPDRSLALSEEVERQLKAVGYLQ